MDHALRGRILALDLGSKRIGLALSDPMGFTAQGLETLVRTSKRADMEKLTELIRQHEVRELVLGHPLRMSGESGTQAGKAADFAEELRAQTGLSVHLWDERLSSAEARRLLDQAGLTREQRKGKVDRMAAVLILQSFLDHRRATLEPHPS